VSPFFLVRLGTSTCADVDRPVFSVFPGGEKWTDEDADLSKTVLITLGSGSKTSRAFVQQLACRRDSSRGPVALIEVTESGSSIAGTDLHFKHKVVGYKTAANDDTLQWLAALDSQVARIVVIDFGGRGDTLSQLRQRLPEHLKGKKLQIIAVGSEPKVYTMTDLQARAAERAQFKVIQLNTSPIIEALMKEIGDYNAHAELLNEWRRVQDAEQARHEGTERAGTVLGQRLDVRKGVQGDGGLEGAWREMCDGRVRSNTACVIAL
jgi:hypothetical protein